MSALVTAKVKQCLSFLKSLLVPDISEQNFMESLGLSSGQLQDLLIMSQTMTELRDLDEVLGYLLGEIQKNMNLSCGVLMPQGGQSLKVRCHRGFPSGFVQDFRSGLEEGSIGSLFHSSQPQVLRRPDFHKVPELKGLAEEKKWTSPFLAPLTIHGQNLGLFVAGSEDPGCFKGRSADLLQSLVQILAVGVRNAQLSEKMEKFNRRLEAEVVSTTEELTRTNNRLIHRVRELKALYEITIQADVSTSSDQILRQVAAKIQELFEVEQVGFFINQSARPHFADLVAQYPTFRVPKDEVPKLHIDTSNFTSGGRFSRLVFEAFSSGEIKTAFGVSAPLIQELPSDVASALPSGLEALLYRSLIAVPLKSAQKTLGAMVLVNLFPEPGSPAAPEIQELTEEQLRTLNLIANRLATALENLMLDDEIKKRLADLSALHEVSETFYAGAVLEFDLGKVVKIIQKSLPCDSCTFMFFDPVSAEPVQEPALKTVGNPAFLLSTDNGDNVALEVFKEGVSRIIDDVQAPPYVLSQLSLERNIVSMMFVPLKVKKETIGVMTLGSRRKAFFDPHQQRVSELIADRIAVIVQSARLYDKVLQTNRELEKLNQVKSEFVSMVSHELRTPMTAIKGFVDIVLGEEAGPINEQQKKFLNIAHNSIDRLTLLISDLLDISRIESGQMKIDLTPVQIEKILHDSAETYRATIESKNIRFSLQMDKKLPQILADEARVKQVIENLLSNAMKFTPANGQIRITADDMGDFVLIGVADTGPGIRKEEQEKIFDRFYQVDSSLTRQVGGTGLGLAITKSIVEMHAGRIWVESEYGKGSTFRFLLPRYRKTPAGPGPVPEEDLKS